MDEMMTMMVQVMRGVWGGVDILVNCGGVSVRGGALETELEVADWGIAGGMWTLEPRYIGG